MSEPSAGGRLLGHLRARILSGLAVLVPLVVTLWVLRGILRFVGGLILPLFGTVLTSWPPLAREAVAAAVVLVALYLLGSVTRLVVGRRLLALGEGIMLRVPFARVIYRGSKQVLESFQSARPEQFRSVVALDFPKEGSQSIGFVTATLGPDQTDPLITVFVPTTPNPTTGFLQVVPRSQTRKLDIPVEDAIKTVMSLGVLGPELLASQLGGFGVEGLDGLDGPG